MIQVKCFEEDHECDLENEINQFLSTLDEDQLIDLKLSCCHFVCEDEQIFSFTACLLYRIKSEKQDRLSSRRKKV